MFSPTYFEKLDLYIEKLDRVADLACDHSLEIGIEPISVEDVTPVCSKCLKRRKLNFEGLYGPSSISSSHSPYVMQRERHPAVIETTSQDLSSNDTTTSSARNKATKAEDRDRLKFRQPLSPATSPPCDVTMSTPKRSSKFRRRYKSDAEGLFMSSMLKALVSLNSTRETLDLTCNTSETPSKKKAWFKRRHTTILHQNTSELSDRYNAAVSDISPSLRKHKHNSCTISRDCPRKARRMSFPGNLERAMTSPDFTSNITTAKDMRTGSSQLDSIAKPPTAHAPQQVEIRKTKAAEESSSRICRSSDNIAALSRSNDKTEGKAIQIETAVAAEEPDEKSLHIYYSLSPAMLDSPLKIDHLKNSTASHIGLMASQGSEDQELKVEDLNSATTESRNADEYSTSSNHEYFDIIAKAGKSPENSRCHKHTLPAKVCSNDESENIVEARLCKTAGDDSGNEDSNVINNSSSLFRNDGDGLLYTSSFGIGDHGWSSVLPDGDIIEDGYCKCSFCNHDVIVTPAKGIVVDATSLKTGEFVKEFAIAHEGLQKLQSSSLHADSIVTSLRASQYSVWDYFQRECGDSHDPQNASSQLDINWNVPCSEDEGSVADNGTSVRVCSTRKVPENRHGNKQFSTVG